MIAIIAALAENKVIGNKNKLPWNIPEEMAVFKQQTKEKTVIMGRKTFESIGRPLPHRHNIVISSSMPETQGVQVCASIEKGIAEAKKQGKDAFVIGGATIYSQAIPLVDKMYLSHIKGEYPGDTYFPEFDQDEWIIEKEEPHEDFIFRIYARKGAKK